VSGTENDFDPEDYEGVSEKMATLPRSEVRRMQKRLRELDDARAERDAAMRQLAFSRAGIDLDDPAAEWFMKGYDGDMTADAVKAAAIKARLLHDGDNAAAVSGSEAAGHQLLAQVANGAGVVSAEDEISRQLGEVGRTIHWRNADQAQAEIMRIVGQNDIKYYPGAVLGT
jgi:hypothetical protein